VILLTAIYLKFILFWSIDQCLCDVLFNYSFGVEQNLKARSRHSLFWQLLATELITISVVVMTDTPDVLKALSRPPS